MIELTNGPTKLVRTCQYTPVYLQSLDIHNAQICTPHDLTWCVTFGDLRYVDHQFNTEIHNMIYSMYCANFQLKCIMTNRNPDIYSSWRLLHGLQWEFEMRIKLSQKQGIKKKCRRSNPLLSPPSHIQEQWGWGLKLIGT